MKTPWLVATGGIIEADILNDYSRKTGVQTITPGVDINWFHPRWISKNRQQVRRAENIADGEMVILFIGSEFRRKGLDHLIAAMGAGMRLLVVGAGEKMRRYRRITENHGLQDQVSFKGLSEDVRRYYAAADVVVLPSLRDAFGMTILEGMACGLCVVTTPDTGVSTLIKDGTNGFIARSPEHLKDVLNRLTDPGLREKAGKSARKTAQQHTWDHVADRYEKLYFQVLEKRKSERLT
jgi:UDP-glucose:(heptosyl)LPS alpha-1,3-glucosyltransferase